MRKVMMEKRGRKIYKMRMGILQRMKEQFER
jgi:hypothetical protein